MHSALNEIVVDGKEFGYLQDCKPLALRRAKMNVRRHLTGIT